MTRIYLSFLFCAAVLLLSSACAGSLYKVKPVVELPPMTGDVKSATAGGVTVRVAPLMSDAEWEQLRSSTERDAWMPESRRRAVPKVSRLGTRFFAHPPGHAAGGSRESDLHLYLKAQCLI